MKPDYLFWNKIRNEFAKGNPFFTLAPMADVTDSAFRQMFAKYGKPDITWTEFVAADGIVHEEGRKHLLKDLEYTEAERPVVAQLFTSSPENMAAAVTLCKELGFDGVDINMGCPVDVIGKQGAGAALIRTPELAIEIIRAARAAAGDMPVSVKTRIGYNTEDIKGWIGLLLKEDLPALTVHLRTKKEMSLVPAHWEKMSEVVALNQEITGGKTLIIGNGDVRSLEDGVEKAQATGADGIMVGRAVFGTPWFFNRDPKTHQKTLREQFDILLEHTRLFERILGTHKSFAIMKKHYKAYVNGFDGAKELRMTLMEANNSDEIEKHLVSFMAEHPELKDQIFVR